MCIPSAQKQRTPKFIFLNVLVRFLREIEQLCTRACVYVCVVCDGEGKREGERERFYGIGLRDCDHHS